MKIIFFKIKCSLGKMVRKPDRTDVSVPLRQHIHFFPSTAATNVYKHTMRWLITIVIQQLDPHGISAEILEGEGEDPA